MNKAAKQELVSAKAKHYLFKSKLRAYLEGSTEVDENVLSDYTACGVGKWITEIGRVKFKGYKEIEQLDVIHRSIHETAKVIIEFKKKGLHKEAEAKMADINQIGNKIVDKIDELSKLLEANEPSQ